MNELASYLADEHGMDIPDMKDLIKVCVIETREHFNMSSRQVYDILYAHFGIERKTTKRGKKGKKAKKKKAKRPTYHPDDWFVPPKAKKPKSDVDPWYFSRQDLEVMTNEQLFDLWEELMDFPFPYSRNSTHERIIDLILDEQPAPGDDDYEGPEQGYPGQVFRDPNFDQYVPGQTYPGHEAHVCAPIPAHILAKLSPKDIIENVYGFKTMGDYRRWTLKCHVDKIGPMYNEHVALVNGAANAYWRS